MAVVSMKQLLEAGVHFGPFDSARKMMSTLHSDDGHIVLLLHQLLF